MDKTEQLKQDLGLLKHGEKIGFRIEQQRAQLHAIQLRIAKLRSDEECEPEDIEEIKELERLVEKELGVVERLAQRQSDTMDRLESDLLGHPGIKGPSWPT